MRQHRLHIQMRDPGEDHLECLRSDKCHLQMKNRAVYIR